MFQKSVACAHDKSATADAPPLTAAHSFLLGSDFFSDADNQCILPSLGQKRQTKEKKKKRDGQRCVSSILFSERPGSSQNQCTIAASPR